MFYIVDRTEGTKVIHPRTRHTAYDTKRGAAIAKASIVKITGYTSHDLTIMDSETYHQQVPMVEVKNLMTGLPVLIRKDAVGGCTDPSTERYWSM